MRRVWGGVGVVVWLGTLASQRLIGAGIDADAATNQAGVAAGRIVYHGERARRCVDSLIALPCEQWGDDDELRRFPDCQGTYEAKVAPGGACDLNQDCIGGHCEASACVADPKTGDACRIGECARALVCLYGV